MIASKFPEKKVMLVDANSTLIKRTPPKAQKIALDQCIKLGIEVLLNERVVHFDVLNGTFETATGRKLQFDKVIIATGPVPNTELFEYFLPEAINSKKEIMVHFPRLCLSPLSLSNVGPPSSGR